MNYTFGAIILAIVLPFLITSSNEGETSIATDQRLAEVLITLGEAPPAHYVADLDPKKVEQGKDLVLKGYAYDDSGKKTRIQSKHFKCTACHNVVKESYDLTVSDPQTRLEYAVEKGIPFLQGSSLYGVVNKESWYNEDYVKKYGSLVEAAHKDLKGAIHLCATECSQGRALKDWEMEAVLHYLWSIDLKMSDLNWSDEQKERFTRKTDKEAKRDLLRSSFEAYNAAHFGDLPNDPKKGYGPDAHEPNIENGQHLYQLSCLHCHQEGGYTNLVLDDSPLTFKMLKSNMACDNHLSLYQAVRKGTYAVPGYKPYMPHYTLEKMSNGQVEDLRAFIEDRAGGS